MSDHDPTMARFQMPTSIDQLRALLQMYIDQGTVRGNNTARILMDRLDRAEDYAEAGQTAASQAQIASFINQVNGFAPQFIDQAATAALATEAAFLLN